MSQNNWNRSYALQNLFRDNIGIKFDSKIDRDLNEAYSFLHNYEEGKADNAKQYYKPTLELFRSCFIKLFEIHQDLLLSELGEDLYSITKMKAMSISNSNEVYSLFLEVETIFE